MKANSLEELVTNSNIAGELRNYTDWHTRLVKFAQLVADWQKEQDERVYREFFNERNQGDASFRDLLAYKEGHRDGMEEQKNQMMKEAVEGVIEEASFNNGEKHNTIRFSFDEESLHVENRIWFPRSGKDGDKVRIIVLKAEEE